MAQGQAYKVPSGIRRQNDREDSPFCQQAAYRFKQFVKIQSVRMAGRISLPVRTQHLLRKIRRIGNNRIKHAIRFRPHLPHILFPYPDPVGPGRSCNIFQSLLHRGFIHIYSTHRSLAALGCHQGDQAGSGSQIQHTPLFRQLCPRPDQHSVGADLHGTTVVTNRKLLEFKIRIRHILVSLFPKMSSKITNHFRILQQNAGYLVI